MKQLVRGWHNYITFTTTVIFHNRPAITEVVKKAANPRIGEAETDDVFCCLKNYLSSESIIQIYFAYNLFAFN